MPQTPNDRLVLNDADPQPYAALAITAPDADGLTLISVLNLIDGSTKSVFLPPEQRDTLIAWLQAHPPGGRVDDRAGVSP